ncbi:MAG: hypothetical protein RLZZ370_261 [Bacteroidota bacterium]
MKDLAFTILLSLCVKVGAQAAILPASITGTTILDAANSPYTMNASVTVAKGGSLRVMPGVRIQSTGSYTLFVNGELQCLGNKDSLVHLENMVVVFNSGAVGYQKTSGGGSKFLYTRFAPGQASTAMRSSKADVFAHHCVFEDVTYAISASTDSVDIYLSNSKILGRTNGYSIFNSYKNWHLELTEDTIVNGGYLYMGSSNLVRKCLFLGGSNTYYGLYGQAHTKQALIECNFFKSIYYGINLSALAAGHGRFVIRDNFVDSTYYGLYLPSMGIVKDSFTVSGNAFLRCTYAAYFLNSTSAPTVQNWSWSGNYWGTSDTTQIKSRIYDHRRFSMIGFQLDYRGYLTQVPAPCGPVPGGFTSGLNHNSSTFDVRIFPNPADGIFHVQVLAAGTYTWRLYDLNGRLLMDGRCTGTLQEVNGKGWKAGSYLLHLSNNEGITAVQKVMLR